MWKRMGSVVLLGGIFLFGTLARGEDLADLLYKGRQAYRSGNYDDAEHYHRLAVTAAESAKDEAKLAEAMGDLGGVLLAKGRYGEAKSLLLNALSQLSHVPESPSLPVSLNNLGFLATQMREFAEAERYLNEALRTLKAVRPKDPYLARVLNNLGALHNLMNERGRAVKDFKEAIDLIEEALGPDSVELAPLLNNLASIYAIDRKWDAATALFGRALFVLQGSPGTDHVVMAGILDSIGGMQFRRNNLAHAETVLRQGYAIRLKVFGPAHPLVALSAVNLAQTLSARGNHEEAERLFADALQVYEKTLGSRSSEVVATLEKLTELLRKTRREEEARVMAARANDIRFELNSVVGVKSLR